MALRANSCASRLPLRGVRKTHQWSRTKLLPWVDSTNQVRISGWLMLDPEHADMVGSARGTIWEVHPITKIEMWKNGAWVDLETQ